MTRREGDDGAVIARSFAVLDSFIGQPVMGISAIAQLTGLPRSTVHRIAQQLVDVGALARVGREYRLGVKLFELGSTHYPVKLRDAIHPFLVDLQRVTGADVTTAEAIGSDIVIVESVPTRGSGAAVVKLGARLPGHATAAGKIIMAFSGEHEPGPGAHLTPVTTRTVVDRPLLERELIEARRTGVAFDRGEMEPGRSGVAAPLLNRHGRVLGALMATGADGDFDPVVAAAAVAAIARTLTRIGQSADIAFYARLRPHHRDAG